jgi:hypothetical protein
VTHGARLPLLLVLDGVYEPDRGFDWKMGPVDIDGAERLKDGLLRARRIDFDEAIRRYGKS